MKWKKLELMTVGEPPPALKVAIELTFREAFVQEKVGFWAVAVVSIK